MKNILIVGASGNIASFLSKWLSKKKHYYRTYTLSRSDKNATIHTDINLLSPAQIYKMYEQYKINAVLHCAAFIHPSTPEEVFFNAYSFTKFLTGDNKIMHVILGSVAEYGHPQGCISEKTKESPQTLYGLSKLLQKEAASYFSTTEDQNIVYLRISNVLMPHAQPTSLLENIFKAAEKNTSFTINDMHVSRDYIDIRDVAQCIEQLLKKKKGAHSFLYNLTSEKRTSYRSLMHIIKNAWDYSKKPFPQCTVLHATEPYTKGIYDNTKIRTDFNWEPRYSLYESIKWIIKNKYA